jgi:hypothetical protein
VKRGHGLDALGLRIVWFHMKPSYQGVIDGEAEKEPGVRNDGARVFF